MTLFKNMKDKNLGIGQPRRPCTNQNSIHTPQNNGDVLSEIRAFVVCGPSTTVESPFSTFDYWGSMKFKKCDSSKCTLANSFFQPNKKSQLACH